MYTIDTFKEQELSKIGEHDPFKNYIEIDSESNSPGKERALHFTLFTTSRKYHIKAIEGVKEDSEGKGSKSYLGCIMENRAPYPGETHLRGSDLPDGEFNQDTWNSIIINILNNELQSIFQIKPLKTVIENKRMVLNGEPEQL